MVFLRLFTAPSVSPANPRFPNAAFFRCRTNTLRLVCLFGVGVTQFLLGNLAAQVSLPALPDTPEPAAWSVELPTDEGLQELAAKEEDLPQVVREAMAEAEEAFARGDFAQARGSYEVARKVVPDNLLLLVNLGLTEFKLGDYAAAEKSLRQAIQRRLELPQAWLVLGLVYLDTQRFESAMAAFAQVVQYEPRNARARNYLGVAVGQLGWFDGAEAEFRRAIELDPKYADAHFNLAYFCLQRREPAVELARRHYTKALELGAERDLTLEAKLRTKSR